MGVRGKVQNSWGVGERLMVCEIGVQEIGVAFVILKFLWRNQLFGIGSVRCGG